MNSTRAHQTFFTAPIRSELSGKAAYSSEKEGTFLQKYSNAGLHAGVFFVRTGPESVDKLAEVLH